MTVAIHSMPFIVRQQMLAPCVQTNAPGADDDRATSLPPSGAERKRPFASFTTGITSACSGWRWCWVAARIAGTRRGAIGLRDGGGKTPPAESESHLWNWLARVARQYVSKARRQQRRDFAVVGVAELPECVAAIESDAAIEKHLDTALQGMAADERQLIELFYFDRLSHKEIAGKLNITPKAVSSRLERAREKLRALITRGLSHET